MWRSHSVIKVKASARVAQNNTVARAFGTPAVSSCMQVVSHYTACMRLRQRTVFERGREREREEASPPAPVLQLHGSES